MQVNALRALTSHPTRGKADVFTPVIAKFEHENEHVSLTALQAIGGSKLKEKEGTDVWKDCRLRLVRIISNRNQAFTWRQQGEAAIALAKIYGQSELALLNGLLTKERNPRLRAKVIEAIGEVSNPEAAEILLAIRDTEKAVIMECTNALVKVCKDTTLTPELKDRAYQTILSFLERNDMAVTTTAASALADSVFLRESSVEPLMLAYSRLKTPDDVETMVEIAKALGALKSAKSISLLEQALLNEDNTVVTAAAQALKNITGKDYSDRIPKHSAAKYTDYDWKYFDAIRRDQEILLRTSRGDIKIRLFPDEAPFTVMSMMKLIDKGFFNGLVFHRVVSNFVIQGGDPRGDGWGGPGYAIRSEFSLLKYRRGMVGVASAGKDTEGCQLFVTHCPTPHLDGRYTIFGQVLEGMEVVDAIQVGDRIESVAVTRK
ncbi:MAG: peptidylprolyl isomerase [Candidatus Eisenbacteria bacterium]|nr:peptidylprolyl isomerase [Candidatus Eisenbacteria bacterium]